MKLKNLFSIGLLLIAICVYANHVEAQTGCCPSPDSLIVTSVTDTSFCVKWRIKDTIGCDTPKAGQLQYKPLSSLVWTKVTIIYNSGSVYASLCDSASPCTKYQWRVRNVCVHGDT